MTPMQPYLVKALISWISDNNMSPYAMVDANMPGVKVPQSAVREGKIVLNLAARAVSRFNIDDHGLSFSARFSGRAQDVVIPFNAIRAIFANETGRGMGLPMENNPSVQSAISEPPTPPNPRGHLRVVK